MSARFAILAKPGGPRCRLGTIVADFHGCAFGLSALHILSRSEAGTIFDANGDKVGALRRDGNPIRGEDSAACFSELVGRFELIPDAPTFANCDFPRVSLVPVRSSQTLHWTASDGSDVHFTVIGRGGEVAFRRTDNEPPTYYENPIVLAIQDLKTAALPGIGDAGSALLNAEGEAVALLISTDGLRFYAAPLDTYMARFGLRSLRPRQYSPTPAPGEPLRSGAIEAIAKEAVANIYAGLSEEQAVHDDPAGNNVPAHLIRELEDLTA